jgi:hypothetical protein
MSLFGKLKEKFSSGAKEMGQGISKGSKILVKRGMVAGKQIGGKLRAEVEYQRKLKANENLAYRKARLKYASQFGKVKAKQEFQQKVAHPEQRQGLGQGMTFLPMQEPSHNKPTNSMPIFEFGKPNRTKQTRQKKASSGKKITIQIG